MKIVYEQPPIRDELGKVFRLPDTAIFTFGDTIYNPGRNPIDPFLMAHEEAHSRQQKDDPSGWWQRYLADIPFRVSQETEAYRVQYRAAKKVIKDKNQLFNFAKRLAEDLSGEQYGSVISFSSALRQIRA